MRTAPRKKAPSRSRVTNKSVRDFPVTASRKGDGIALVVRLGRDVFSSVAFGLSDWPQTPIGNPRSGEREFLRATLGYDFTADNGCLLERIVDAAHMAVRDLLEAEPSAAA